MSLHWLSRWSFRAASCDFVDRVLAQTSRSTKTHERSRSTKVSSSIHELPNILYPVQSKPTQKNWFSSPPCDKSLSLSESLSDTPLRRRQTWARSTLDASCSAVW